MSRESIPSGVRDLLREYITSYEQLEVLLCLARGRDRDPLTADALAAELHMPEPLITQALEQLEQASVVRRRAGGFRALAQFAERLDALAAAYEADRVAVMRLMTTNALERVRTSAARTFAAAFLLRKRDDG